MTQIFFRKTAKTLIRLDGCPCWSECLLAQSSFYSFEPPHDKTDKMACAPSEDSDQPGHPPSLIRVFAVRMTNALATHWAHSEDSDQIWVFAWCTVILLALSWGGSFYLVPSLPDSAQPIESINSIKVFTSSTGIPRFANFGLSCCMILAFINWLPTSFSTKHWKLLFLKKQMYFITECVAFSSAYCRCVVASLKPSPVFEPPHDKTNKMTMHPAKTQISLGIRPVWSESSLAHNEYLRTQAFFMRTEKKIWSDWAHIHFVGFVISRLIYLHGNWC